MGTQKALLINIITASLHDHRTMYILYSWQKAKICV